MKKLLSAIAALALTVSPLAASARNMTESEINTYINLIETVKKTGVTFKLNPPDCDTIEGNIFGWYQAKKQELVVCQENRIKGSRQYVRWSEEDLDTLRHEAHHLVQDCVDKKLNGRLHFLYEDPASVVKQTLSSDMIKQVIGYYKDLHPYHRGLELEAFSVAAMNDPQEQIKDIQNYCGVR